MGDEKIMQNFKSIWACAVEKMRDSFNDTAFDLWISTIEPLKYEDDCAILRVESDFQKKTARTISKPTHPPSRSDIPVL